MSDQNELRDRIAKVLDQNFNPDQYPIMTAMFRDYAQAIIDEFGMTVETEPGHDPIECGCSSRAYPAESRIVGKWEKQ